MGAVQSQQIERKGGREGGREREGEREREEEGRREREGGREGCHGV